MKTEKILTENGWTVECESPFEIRHENGSFATMSAAYSVASELLLSETLERINLIKDSYKAELIDKDTFVSKIIETLEK